MKLRNRIQRLARQQGWTVERYPHHHSLDGHLQTFFRQHAIDCVLDVGGNRGQFASSIRHFGYRGSIVSFEPVPEAYAQLVSRAADDHRWEARQLALGDENGRRPFNVTISNSVSSFLTPTADYAGNYAGGAIERTLEVEVARLDSLFTKVTRPGQRVFLKIDTQGHDLKVLEGAIGSLDKIVGLQIELSVMPIYDDMTEYIVALARIRELGFIPTGMFPVVRDEMLRVYEFDGVFVHATP